MANQPKVILTEHLDADAADWLGEQVDLHVVRFDDPAFNDALADAHGLVVRTYTQVNRELLAAAPKLKVVGRAGVGLDNIDLPACQEAGVTVVYTPDANTQAVVEYVWSLIADVWRPRFYFNDYLAPPTFHEHRQTHVGKQYDQYVLGVLGMGRVGRRVAEVAHAFGMRVLYNDLLTRRELALPEGELSEFVDKPTLYRDADVLTIHVDGRPENRHLIDADVLGQLKPTCLLINAARGMLIDNDALAAWAKQVAEAGGVAVLDVHDPEPPPDDYPLYGIENVKLLPHLASRTPVAMANMSQVVQDVVAVLRGEKPKWPAF